MTDAGTSLLVDHIGLLVTNDPAIGSGPLGFVPGAALVVEDGFVAWVGPDDRAPAADLHVDGRGRCVIPGFVDSHTHLVFAGDRVDEFTARMAGRPYSAGGIRSTVEATRKAPDRALLEGAVRLAREAERQGTTTLETKSGYGLTIDDELRSLAVAGAVTDEVTFLGAHVVPSEYAGREDAYVALVKGPMLDRCAPEARWCDVFCDQGAFGPDEAREILVAAKAKGLGLRVHANQLGPGGGVRLAAELGAASADHVTHVGADDIAALADSGTVATLLPGAEFSTRSPYPDARRLRDAGVTVALATDCNPGTSFTTSMPLIVALAVREMGLTPDEAVWAATAGGGRALRRADVGRLGIGCRGDLVVLDAPSHAHIAYRPGVDLVAEVVRGGTVVWRREELQQ
jgi:imidazolonepropionase